MSDREPDSGDQALPDWLVVVLLTQGTALLIALVTPITPSKTGSTWSPAELFWTDPSYFAEVLASFLAVNAIIAVLGLIAWAMMRRERSG